MGAMQHMPALALDTLRLAVWFVLLMLVFVPFERRFALHRQKALRAEFGEAGKGHGADAGKGLRPQDEHAAGRLRRGRDLAGERNLRVGLRVRSDQDADRVRAHGLTALVTDALARAAAASGS
jgi:hypothetical protein